MSWSQRLQELEAEAERTHFFWFNKTTRKLYSQLRVAIRDKNSAKTRNLIVRMGF